MYVMLAYCALLCGVVRLVVAVPRESNEMARFVEPKGSNLSSRYFLSRTTHDTDPHNIATLSAWAEVLVCSLVARISLPFTS